MSYILTLSSSIFVFWEWHGLSTWKPPGNWVSKTRFHYSKFKSHRHPLHFHASTLTHPLHSPVSTLTHPFHSSVSTFTQSPLSRTFTLIQSNPCPPPNSFSTGNPFLKCLFCFVGLIFYLFIYFWFCSFFCSWVELLC